MVGLKREAQVLGIGTRLARCLVGVIAVLVLLGSAAPVLANRVVDRTVPIRFLRSPTSSVTGYIVAVRRIGTGSVSLSDIGGQFSVDSAGVATAFVTLTVERDANYEMFMVAYNDANVLSPPSNGLRISENPVSYRINSGNFTARGAGEQFWLRDSQYTADGRDVIGQNRPIAGAAVNYHYAVQREATTTGGRLNYRFPVEPGNYTVRLHFAEIDPSVRAGDRVAEIVIEGSTVLASYDTYAAVGFETADVVEYETSVSDGEIHIELRSRVGRARIAGIEIVNSFTRFTSDLCITNSDCGQLDACTLGGVCVDGQCGAASSASCPTPTQCQVGGCDAQSGCFVSNRSNGSTCNDGDSGTLNDVCSSGVCVGSLPTPPPPPPPTPEPEPEPEPEPSVGPLLVTSADELLTLSFSGSTSLLDVLPSTDLRPAVCELDGDGHRELVIGGGPGTGGIVWILDLEGPSAGNFATLSAGFSVYNLRDGQTRPACGDIDGDGRDEIVVGLSKSTTFMRVFDDRSTGFAPWSGAAGGLFNTGVAGSWPAVADFDGNGVANVVLAVDGVGNSVRVLRDGNQYLRHWKTVGFSTPAIYHRVGMIPSVGDTDGDGSPDLILGYETGGGGQVVIMSNLTNPIPDATAITVGDSAFQATDGATRPIAIDLDRDGADELVIGLGPAGIGQISIRNDAITGYVFVPSISTGLPGLLQPIGLP